MEQVAPTARPCNDIQMGMKARCSWVSVSSIVLDH